MLSILDFIFGNFWHWTGATIMLAIIVNSIVAVARVVTRKNASGDIRP